MRGGRGRNGGREKRNYKGQRESVCVLFQRVFLFLHINIRPMNLKQFIMVVLWKIPKPTKLVNAHIKICIYTKNYDSTM